MREFSKLAKEAYDLLSKPDTSFIKNKNTIKKLFESSVEIDGYEQLVLARLGLIDDFYSTNINKSNDAIQELAADIISLGNDNEVKEKFKNFYNGCDDDISTLFGKKRGWIWDKNMQKITKGHQSISLISKYAYFLTGFNFPIYDSLMRRMLLKLGIKKQYGNITKYVKSVKKVCDVCNITIDELDACGWLIGKMEDAEKTKSPKVSLIGEVKKYLDFYRRAENILSKRSRI